MGQQQPPLLFSSASLALLAAQFRSSMALISKPLVAYSLSNSRQARLSTHILKLSTISFSLYAYSPFSLYASSPSHSVHPTPSPADFLSYPGEGFSAQFSSAPRPLSASQPQPLLGRRALLQTQQLVTAAPQPAAPAQCGTLAELEAAVGDPAVTAVVLTAHIALAGAPLAVAGANRSLTVTSASSSSAAAGGCRATTTPWGTAIPAGLCALDAGGRSRHFTVSNGASLTLDGVALVGGAETQGGSVLAVSGSAVSVRGCVVADSWAAGDGGAILALAGSRATVRQSALSSFFCTSFQLLAPKCLRSETTADTNPSPLPARATGNFSNCTAVSAGGGALSALHGSSLLVTSGTTFRQCVAINGGALAAAVRSAVDVRQTVFDRTRCALIIS